MMICLVHNAQTGQMQYIMEGGDPQMACHVMEIAVKQIRSQLQNGVVTPPKPPTPFVPPPPPPRNIREVIHPKEPPAAEQ